jgi:hypothetical protein
MSNSVLKCPAISAKLQYPLLALQLITRDTNQASDLPEIHDLEKLVRNSILLYIAAFLPEPFGCRMQRHFEVAFGSIAHHLRER